MRIKAKNCTGKTLEVGMVVYVEPDKRNIVQKILGIKRKIVEIANPSKLSDIDTSQFIAGEKIFLGENGSLISKRNLSIINGSDINKEIYQCLEHLSNSVGDTITEYHWREFCDLMKMMVDENMITYSVAESNVNEDSDEDYICPHLNTDKVGCYIDVWCNDCHTMIKSGI